MSSSFLLVGLGNPGVRYSKTRHNIGFLFLDYFLALLNSSFRKGDSALYTVIFLEDKKIIALKPISGMNISGGVVRAYQKFYKINCEHTIVVYDELDFPFGKFKLKIGGSSGGHNGVNSLIQHCLENTFIRLRVGISRPKVGEITDYVLGQFMKKEEEQLSVLFNSVSEAFVDIISHGASYAMQKFNSV